MERAPQGGGVLSANSKIRDTCFSLVFGGEVDVIEVDVIEVSVIEAEVLEVKEMKK